MAFNKKIRADPGTSTHGVAFDLLSTAGVTLGTTFASLASVALLARILERNDFLNYTLLLRYLSLAIVVLGVGAGFSFIGGKGKDWNDSETASLLSQVLFICLCIGFIPWLVFSTWVSTSAHSWPTWTVFGYFWVLAHTAFILSGPVARARGGVGEYVWLALGCRTAPYAFGVALVLLTGEFMGMLVGYGVCSIFWLLRFWSKDSNWLESNFESRAALSLLRFGITRWLDDIVRTLLPVALILATSFFLSSAEAAIVALVYLVARVLESMMQPLVIAIMMRDRKASPSLPKDLLKALLLVSLLTVLLVFFQAQWEQLFVVFLGDQYEDITGLSWMMMLSAGSIISLNYLRACYDNYFSNSPVFFINLAFIFILVGSVIWCDSVHKVIVCAVLAHAGRLVCYTGTLVVFLGWRSDRHLKS